MATKKKPAKQRVLYTTDGKSYAVTGETGKYWRCDGTQFRKANPYVDRVETVKPEPTKETEE